MKMTKLTAAAAGLLVAASLAFTSCDGLGKDDFFGLWQSSYVVDAENVSVEDGSGTIQTGYAGAGKEGSSVEIAMYFDGTSEKLINANQKFYQFKTRTQNDVLESSTFWIGTYKLKGNSNYTNGTLILTYRLGWSSVTEAQANALGKAYLCSTAEDAKAALEDAGTDVFASVPDVQDNQTVLDYLATLGSPTVYSDTQDVETFDFELGGQSFFKGYTTMKATAKNNCSWEVWYREFELQNTLADIVKGMLDGADGSSASEAN